MYRSTYLYQPEVSRTAVPVYVPVYLPVPAGFQVCVTQPYFILEHVIMGTASVVLDLRVVIRQARVRQCLETCTRSSSSSGGGGGGGGGSGSGGSSSSSSSI